MHFRPTRSDLIHALFHEARLGELEVGLDQAFEESNLPIDRDRLALGSGYGRRAAKFHPGVDFAAEMLKQGAACHPELRFIQADAEHITLEQKFDFIILFRTLISLSLLLISFISI